MEWEELGEDLTSAAIKQKCREFVQLLMQQSDDGRQEINKTASDDNGADIIQRKGNMEETTLEELGDVFLPPITSTQVQTRDGGQKDAGVAPGTEVALDLVN